MATLLVLSSIACGAQFDDAKSDQAQDNQIQVSDTATSNSDSAQDEAFDQVQVPQTDLQTGQPLSTLLTPFRWGRLSLLSITSYQGYNSNPQFGSSSAGSYITSINGLLAYSASLSGWQMSILYEPFVWIFAQHTVTNFEASAFDLRKYHRLSPTWKWAATEHLRYSPVQSSAEQRGFAIVPGGISFGNTFLSSGRNDLTNSAGLVLTNTYSRDSSLSFHANQSTTYLSSYSTDGVLANIPGQAVVSLGVGTAWHNRMSPSNTLLLGYDFRLQTSSGTGLEDVMFHTVSLGLSHAFRRTLTLSGVVGPGWAMYLGKQNSTTTLHGSLALAKQFRQGNIVLGASRNSGFTGVISNTFHNRYDLAIERAITSKFRGTLMASYIQQQMLHESSTHGQLDTLELSYMLNRNWSTFCLLRYLDITGNNQFVAPEKSAIVGFRWAWVPQKP